MWLSLTLKDIMPSAFSKAQAALAKAREGLDSIADAVLETEAGLIAAQNMVSALESDLATLAETGFAVIVLSPLQGSWIGRLLSAPNAPENNSAMYSCGYINLSISPTEAGALAAYEAVQSALKSDFQDAVLQPSLPEAAALVDLPEFEPPVDQWEGISFGELFPGVLKSVQGQLNTANKLLKTVENTYNKLLEKKDKLEEAVTKASGLISAMESTGQYTLTLSPGVGGWADRAAAEVGAPDTGSGNYVTGFAAVAIASDFAECQELFYKLAAVM